MVAVIDLKAEFARLTMLKGRTPTTPTAEREGAFARVAPYRDGAIFTAKFAGTSAWERHPQGDEIVEIVDGATMLHLMTAEGRQSMALRAGMVAIMPQNTWHRRWCTSGTKRKMTPAANRYAITCRQRTECGRPAASIRFRTATPMAASICWTAKPRARSRGPSSLVAAHRCFDE